MKEKHEDKYTLEQNLEYRIDTIKSYFEQAIDSEVWKRVYCEEYLSLLSRLVWQVINKHKYIRASEDDMDAEVYMAELGRVKYHAHQFYNLIERMDSQDFHGRINGIKEEMKFFDCNLE